MESQIEKLKEKYWKGETTLSEEKELKAYFSKNISSLPEPTYFRKLKLLSDNVSNDRFDNPGKNLKKSWWLAAASITIGIMVALAVFRDAQQYDPYLVDDPQEAYEITKRALMMVSVSINDGGTYASELKKINKAEEIITEN